MSKRTQWLVAAAILLVGVAISALLLFGPGQTGEMTTLDNGPLCRVTFYDQDGQVLEVREVAQGRGVLPPELAMEGYRFMRWSEDLYAVSDDLEVYPMGLPLGEEKNLVYADAVYGEYRESVSVIPRLAGRVDCCAFSIELAYDSGLLDFKRAEPLLEGLRVEENRREGILTLTFEGEENLTQASDLAELTFRCREDGNFRTNLTMTTTEILTRNHTETVYTDSVACDTDLYLLRCS